MKNQQNGFIRWIVFLFAGLLIIVVGLFLFYNKPTISEKIVADNSFPKNEIIIEQDDKVVASYSSKCSFKSYFIYKADWIVDVIVENVEKFDNNPNDITTVSTSKIQKYIKGTPVADKLVLKRYSEQYSTSGDHDILFKEGNVVRVYLVDAFKVTGLEEHRGVFGFVCWGVEQI